VAAARSSETSVWFHLTTSRHSWEESRLHNRGFQNLKLLVFTVNLELYIWRNCV